MTETVYGGDVSVTPPGRSVFAGPDGERVAAALVDALGEDLRAELATGAPVAPDAVPGRSVGRTVQLLRIARLLDVDCAELLPEVVRRMARGLLDEGAGDCARVLLDLLDEQFDVRTALLGELDRSPRTAPGRPNACWPVSPCRSPGRRRCRTCGCAPPRRTPGRATATTG